MSFLRGCGGISSSPGRRENGEMKLEIYRQLNKGLLEYRPVKIISQQTFNFNVATLIIIEQN